MVTMIDLWAKKCIPCKMMAPIMEKMGVRKPEMKNRKYSKILFDLRLLYMLKVTSQKVRR